MDHLEMLTKPISRASKNTQRGRLVLQMVVPTDRRSAGGRTAFSVAVELSPTATRDGLLPAVLAGLVFTLGEELAGVVAEVTPDGGTPHRLLFATEDRGSLRSVIGQHWRDDRRIQFHVCTRENFRKATERLRAGQGFDPSLASLKVMQNQSHSGLIVRGDALNAVRARAQVERLCLQYNLDLVL